MPRRLVGGLVGTAALFVAGAGWAQVGDISRNITNGVPVIGVDVGAAIPISNFRDTADPGGAIAPFLGWQLGSGRGFTLMPLVRGEFAGFTENDGAGTPTLANAGGGLRASLNDEETEIYVDAGGGYYWSTSGPTEHDDGGGYDVGGGVNYEFWRGTALGAFARYHQASINPRPGSAEESRLRYLTTGIELRHRFLPAEPPPPAPVAAAPPPAAPAAPVRQKIVLRGVHFDFDKATIRADAKPILDEAARTLQQAGDVHVAVNGYTDSVGSEAYNQRLSVRRAEAVRAYLEQQGVAASRLAVTGHGEADPVASNATAEGRAQNRRVELIVAD